MGVFDDILLEIVEVDVNALHALRDIILAGLHTIVVFEKQYFELSLWRKLNHSIENLTSERAKNCPVRDLEFFDEANHRLACFCNVVVSEHIWVLRALHFDVQEHVRGLLSEL